jgi:hypothetical protein
MATITWKCPNCWTQYEIDERFAEALKDKQDCKFCVRKDPNVPTTAEVDGLLTIEDIRNRKQLVRQCTNCRAWTQMESGKEEPPCTGIVKGARLPKFPGCGLIAYDIGSAKSLRCFNPLVDMKKRPGAKAKKEK